MKTDKSKSKKPNKAKKPNKPSKPKKPKAAKKKAEEVMDRQTLKRIAGHLKGAGSGVKILKSDTDEALQRKVNEAIRQLPSAEVVKKLESVDPEKLVSVLKKDCLGIFIDLSDVSCVRCPDAERCAAAFVANLKGGMKVVQGAVSEGDGGKAPTKPLAVKYDGKHLVFIRDVKNPNPKNDDYHDTIQRVLDDQPETLSELRAIVEDDFDIEGDADFMRFVTALRDPKEGVIKLVEDLTEFDKVTLREAGYKV